MQRLRPTPIQAPLKSPSWLRDRSIQKGGIFGPLATSISSVVRWTSPRKSECRRSETYGGLIKDMFILPASALAQPIMSDRMGFLTWRAFNRSAPTVKSIVLLLEFG